MTKFEEMLEEQKKSANKITKIQLKLLELHYKRLMNKTLLNATKAAYESEIYDVNKEFMDATANKKKMETSKFFMYLIIINCSIIEAYSMWSMAHFADLSALPTLMGAVIVESVSFAVYCAKAYFGKKGEVDTELEREKMAFQKQQFLMSTLPEDNSPEEFFDDIGLDDGSVG